MQNLFRRKVFSSFLFSCDVCLKCIFLKISKLKNKEKKLENRNTKRLPKGTARMNHPVAGRFLSYPFFHQRLFAAEELHGQPVVGGLEPCL